MHGHQNLADNLGEKRPSKRDVVEEKHTLKIRHCYMSAAGIDLTRGGFFMQVLENLALKFCIVLALACIVFNNNPLTTVVSWLNGIFGWILPAYSPFRLPSKKLQ